MLVVDAFLGKVTFCCGLILMCTFLAGICKKGMLYVTCSISILKQQKKSLFLSSVWFLTGTVLTAINFSLKSGVFLSSYTAFGW